MNSQGQGENGLIAQKWQSIKYQRCSASTELEGRLRQWLVILSIMQLVDYNNNMNWIKKHNSTCGFSFLQNLFKHKSYP